MRRVLFAIGPDNGELSGVFVFRVLRGPIMRYALRPVFGVSTATSHLVVAESYPLYQLVGAVFCIEAWRGLPNVAFPILVLGRRRLPLQITPVGYVICFGVG